MKLARMAALVGSAAVWVGGCVGTRTVPEVDASKLRLPVIGWLEPKQVRLEVVDERFVPAEDKLKSIDNVRAAIAAALSRVGIAVSANAVNELSLRFEEGDRPIGEFATNECVLVKAALRASAGRQMQVSGFGCAHDRNLYGYSLRGDTTTAFETAINMVFGEIVRLSTHTAPPAITSGGHPS